MIFLDELKNKNIIEYILYMFQVENIIKQNQFDIDKILSILIDKNSDVNIDEGYKKFIEKTITQMKNEKVDQYKHLSDINEIIVELSYLHNTLINLSKDENYKTCYQNSVEHIEEFRQKSNLKNKNHIELMLNALFFNWLLIMQKKKISTETKASMENFRQTLVLLGKAYHQMKNGKLNFFNN